ncbi:MAG TPA: YgiQ family radical SAM protein, partial [Syntrophorhabdaceae bacterium]|nr:YgiQ family radical SAM protein [Syntrophorhabdaceae bacterium]
DWWDNTVRRSILLDARADILVYGMGEQQIVEVADRLSKGLPLDGIRGTTIVRTSIGSLSHRVVGSDAKEQDTPVGMVTYRISGSQESRHKSESGAVDHRPNDSKDSTTQRLIEVPSYEETKEDKKHFNLALRVVQENQDPFTGNTIVQKHGNRYVIQYPPALPLTERELDAIYELPFAKAAHPSYPDGVPGFETVKFSLISHRGCPGQCSFCSLSMHQGRIVQSRSKRSLISEAQALTARKDFKGTISDIGGPTANLYRATCTNWVRKGACQDRSCLTPRPCNNLRLGYRESLEVYRSILNLPQVKHLFIESGIRFDLLNEAAANEYLDQLCEHHVSGQMKIAPEHVVDHVLKLMNKPSVSAYERFSKRFKEANVRTGRKQFLVHYFISAHPGSSLKDTLELSLYLISRRIYPEQIQDFIPLPMTLSGAMFYTGEHPITGKKLAVARSTRERGMHRALIQYRFSGNKPLLREALKLLNREDLAEQFRCKH